MKDLFNQKKIPENDGLRLAIGQDIIDRITKNTQGGRDANGAPLRKPYSKEYSQTPGFKVRGKTRNKVNMRLSGSMLDAMSVTEIKGDKITIGFEQTIQSEKAHGHVTGAVTNGKFERDFFGLPDKQVKSIAATFEDTVQDLVDQETPPQGISVLDIIGAAPAAAAEQDVTALFLSELIRRADEESLGFGVGFG